MLSWSGSLSVILVNFRKRREKFDLLCDRASPPGISVPQKRIMWILRTVFGKAGSANRPSHSRGLHTLSYRIGWGSRRGFCPLCASQKKFPHISITLKAALPYPYSPTKRMGTAAAERAIILAMCDQVTEVSPCYRNGCMQKRNMHMVDKSNLIPAIWNGIEKGGTWNTIQSARHKEKSICYILLHE